MALTAQHSGTWRGHRLVRRGSAIGFWRMSFFRRLAPRGLLLRTRLPEYLGECVEVSAAEIGDRPIGDAVLAPGQHIVAGDRAPRRRAIAAGGRDLHEADQMLPVAIDQRRHRPAPDHVDAASD